MSSRLSLVYGTTREQLLGELLQLPSDGSIGRMVPQGSRQDPRSKIYAIKLHTAKLPVLEDKNYLIPIFVESAFANGNINPAVEEAAKLTYGVYKAKYKWMTTTRDMGIFHGVQPAGRALQCLDCHAPNGRLHWLSFGYKEDPLNMLISAH